ncbi:MAG TPA: GtrA family protein [Rhodopila sp.]|nr:GtrA family protein [Rhodopila sp.]
MQATPDSVSTTPDAVPLGTPPRLAVRHFRLAAEFTRFGVVGAIGFVIDTATVYGLRGALGLYGAGIAAYAVAATTNWLLNRVWTFRGQGSGPAHRQWARFLGSNLLGFALNRGTYAVLVTFVALAAAQPVIATASGAVAGMFVNFAMAKRYVFR